MTLLATLIGRDLAPADLPIARDALAAAGALTGEPAWLDRGEAADLPFDRLAPAAARAALEEALPGTDVVVQPAAGRTKRLLVTDMDSTVITCECIDELADYAGLKAQVAAITERSMRGELDFTGALDERVALLAGLPADTLERCRAERVRPMPGAGTLVRTMRAHGARTVLVSGGFTAFAEPVGRELGFDRVVANRLGMAGGRVSGTVARPVVDAAAKQAVLAAERNALALPAAAVLAVGDGANDIPMIEAAGLGVAFRAKPRTAAAADARVTHGDLHALLWAQGLPRSAWVAA